jgi:hypothetical protein
MTTGMWHPGDGGYNKGRANVPDLSRKPCNHCHTYNLVENNFDENILGELAELVGNAIRLDAIGLTRKLGGFILGV